MPTSQTWQAEWETFTRPNFDIHATPIRPERVVADCQAVLPDDAILACDVGVNHNWYMQFWKARRPQTMLNSWGFSGMGFGAGRRARRQARGARPALRGDRRRRLLHDGAARAVHGGRVRHPRGVGDLEQLRLGRRSATSSSACSAAASSAPCSTQGANKTPYNPDFAGWAKASGVEALTVTKSQDFKGALEHAIAANKPFLLDVHVDAEVRPPATGTWQLPPTPHKEPVFGKRLAAGRARGVAALAEVGLARAPRLIDTRTPSRA